MKKKQLSKIVLTRTLITVMGSFIALLAVTSVIIYAFNRKEINDFVRFSLTNFSDHHVAKSKNSFVSSVVYYTEVFDSSMVSDLDYLKSPELSQELSEETSKGYSETEINIVDPKGVITASSTAENIGFDLNSCPEAKDFLCLKEEGAPEHVVKDMSLKPGGTNMRYCGSPLPKCGGFILIARSPEFDEKRKGEIILLSVKDNNIGNQGYYLCLDSDGKIIGSPNDKHNGEYFDPHGGIQTLSETGKVIAGEAFGVKSYMSALAEGNSYLVAVYPLSEAWNSWIFLGIATVIIYVIVFLILFLVIRHLMTRHVISGVYSLNDSLNRITGGELDEKADFRNSIEFDELSDGINLTVDRLKELIREAEGRIDAELALAAVIQSSFLPHVFPAFPDRNEFELFASMTPAKEVGGDFYDFFLVDSDHLAIVVGDVSGKGIPAAMFLVEAKDQLKHSVMKHGCDVALALQEENLKLATGNDTGLSVSVWLGVLTISTGHMDYVNAGHTNPALSLGGEDFTSTEFPADSFRLSPGDILFLYTDGVTDAKDPDGESFGIPRMLDALNRDKSASVQDIEVNVRSALSDFVQDAPPIDDTTTLVLRYRGTIS